MRAKESEHHMAQFPLVQSTSQLVVAKKKYHMPSSLREENQVTVGAEPNPPAQHSRAAINKCGETPIRDWHER